MLFDLVKRSTNDKLVVQSQVIRTQIAHKHFFAKVCVRHVLYLIEAHFRVYKTLVLRVRVTINFEKFCRKQHFFVGTSEVSRATVELTRLVQILLLIVKLALKLFFVITYHGNLP